MAEEMKKTFACPKCGEHVKCKGKPGAKIVLTCPKCNTKGVVFLSKRENNKEKKQKYKIHATGLTKKQIVGYSVAGIIALLFIFGVLVPALLGQLHFLIVLSESMKPNINMGDIVVTASANPEDIQVGDVITFRQPTASNPDRSVTHRVIEIIDDDPGINFQTKGDANEDPDMVPIKSSDLIGKVFVSIPYIGYLPHYVKTPLGFVLLVIIPGSLIILLELKDVVKNTKNKKKKNDRIRKLFKCPRCGTKVECEGIIDKTIHVVCPSCNNRGVVTLKKT